MMPIMISLIKAALELKPLSNRSRSQIKVAHQNFIPWFLIIAAASMRLWYSSFSE